MLVQSVPVQKHSTSSRKRKTFETAFDDEDYSPAAKQVKTNNSSRLHSDSEEEDENVRFIDAIISSPDSCPRLGKTIMPSLRSLELKAIALLGSSLAQSHLPRRRVNTAAAAAATTRQRPAIPIPQSPYVCPTGAGIMAPVQMSWVQPFNYSTQAQSAMAPMLMPCPIPLPTTTTGEQGSCPTLSTPFFPPPSSNMMLTTISGSLPPSSLYALAECEWLAKSIPPVSLMPSASSSLILETIGLRSIPNPADRDWLCEYIDSQPIATRQARFGLGRDNNITPLGFTVPVAGYLLEKSIRNCEGPECSLGKAAAIAITELLSGVIGDRDSQKKPSGAHDQQWDRRRVASSALAHLATIAVDSVACNPPLVLALLNLLQPCIIPLYDRLGKDQLAAIGGVDGQPMTMESLSNRHYYINAPGGFDKLFLPIVQLTMAMACSNKFRPMVIADIYAPENRIYFERWFAEQHPGKAIPPLVDVEVKLSPDVVANMVTKKDHSLFAYCNSNRSAGAFDNRISIVRALVAKYPQMSTLARFVLYNTRSGKSHIFLACAVFWCIYEEQLQNWYQGLAASKMQPSTNNNNNSASVSSWLKSLGWLTPMNLSAFRYTTFDPTTRKKVVHVTAKKEAMALRLGLYELSLTPNYICAMSMPLWKSKGATRLRTRIGSKLNLVAPEFATLYRRLQTYYLISRHAGEEMMAMAVGEEEEAEEAAAIVVVD